MRTTVTLSDAQEEHLDAIRGQEDEPDASVVRRCVERSQRLTTAEQRVDELETEVQQQQAEIDRLNRKLQEAHGAIETTNELVKRVDSDLSARERKQRASVIQRAKWWLTGMDESDDE
jgi:peptidoglycan hydrolase CwlO-like protein